MTIDFLRQKRSMQNARTIIVRKWQSLRTKSKREKSFLVSFFIFIFFIWKYSVYTSGSSDENNILINSVEGLDGAWQGDPDLEKKMFSLLIMPNWDDPELNEPEREDFSDHGQSKLLSEILKNKEGGFFIEAYAGDGEKSSISLYFEHHLSWSGLLIEKDFKTVGNLLEKERHSYVVNAEISVKETVRLHLQSSSQTTSQWIDPSDFHYEIPFYALYRAMGSMEVDLLILNTNGTELKILQTIPWDMVTIRVMCIAYNHMPGNPRSLPDYLSLKGYTLLKTHITDMFFASNKYLKGEK